MDVANACHMDRASIPECYLNGSGEQYKVSKSYVVTRYGVRYSWVKNPRLKEGRRVRQVSTIEKDFLIRQRGYHDLCRCRCESWGAGHGGHSSWYCGCIFHPFVLLCLEFSALGNVVADKVAIYAAFLLLVFALAFVPLTLVFV